jgi:bleomycin hydrolase
MEISTQDIKNYQRDFDKKSKYKILQGVLRKSSLVNVSANQNAMTKLPFKFNYVLPEEVKTTDQFASGRCWIFSGLNVIRHKLIQHYKLEPTFELSQAYIARWDKLEKCNCAIELIYELAKSGKNNQSLEYSILIPSMMEDGGTWDMFVNVVNKYGIVPKDVYPDNSQIKNTSRMNKLLTTTVMKSSDKINKNMSHGEFVSYKKTIIEECYRIINMCLGNCPERFLWTFKEKKCEQEYTPFSFYKNLVKPHIDVNKFISICNFPLEDYNQTLAVEYMHNVLVEGENIKRKASNTYFNMNNKDFKDAIFKCLKHSYGIWFACDIGQYFINKGSILDKNSSNLRDMFDIDFNLSKKASLETRTSVPNHAMMFSGCHAIGKKIDRWKVENSYGDEVGKDGFITMSDSWFDEFVICAAVHIDCLPVSLRAKAMGRKQLKWLPFHSVLGTFAR